MMGYGDVTDLVDMLLTGHLLGPRIPGNAVIGGGVL